LEQRKIGGTAASSTPQGCRNETENQATSSHAEGVVAEPVWACAMCYRPAGVLPMLGSDA